MMVHGPANVKLNVTVVTQSHAVLTGLLEMVEDIGSLLFGVALVTLLQLTGIGVRRY
jgi:hypothetical protein